MGARYYSDMCDRPTCVYRLYDAEWNLLYVGLSMNPEGRFAKHRRRDWWPRVAHTDLHWLPNREAAKAEERQAIHDENPIHNIAFPTLECCR